MKWNSEADSPQYSLIVVQNHWLKLYCNLHKRVRGTAAASISMKDQHRHAPIFAPKGSESSGLPLDFCLAPST